VQNENLRWAVENLAGFLATFFLLKDFSAIGYLSRHQGSLESLFTVRMAMLPGSLLFWDYAVWGALVVNVLFGAFVGWYRGFSVPGSPKSSHAISFSDWDVLSGKPSAPGKRNRRVESSEKADRRTCPIWRTRS
jgi:hypothetical protein